MRLYIKPPLFPMIACNLIGTNPLSAGMITIFFNSAPGIPWNLFQNTTILPQENEYEYVVINDTLTVPLTHK